MLYVYNTTIVIINQRHSYVNRKCPLRKISLRFHISRFFTLYTKKKSPFCKTKTLYQQYKNRRGKTAAVIIILPGPCNYGLFVMKHTAIAVLLEIPESVHKVDYLPDEAHKACLMAHV